MTYHEKKSLINIITAFLVYGFYYNYKYQQYLSMNMTMEEQLQFWGKTILIAIPIMIGAKIVIHIAFVIVNTIVTREKHPEMEDERDKLIELKSTRNAFFIFGMGFVVALAAIAWGQSIHVMFLVIIAGGLLSELFDNLSRLIYYRRGI